MSFEVGCTVEYVPSEDTKSPSFKSIPRALRSYWVSAPLKWVVFDSIVYGFGGTLSSSAEVLLSPTGTPIGLAYLGLL